MAKSRKTGRGKAKRGKAKHGAARPAARRRPKKRTARTGGRRPLSAATLARLRRKLLGVVPQSPEPDAPIY